MRFDPSAASYIYILPFVGMLLSIALAPIVFPDFWHRHTLKISLGWTATTITLLLMEFGGSTTSHQMMHMLTHEYIPFILMIGALFTITGGIHIVIKGRMGASGNTILLFIGSILASIIGTTGAAMLLIRPFIEINRQRHYKTHLIVFFIFAIANIGGSLTPLGDPPLFLGYLQGVPFEWTLIHMWKPLCLTLLPLLLVFFVIDMYLLKQGARRSDHAPLPHRKDGEARVSITGKINIFFLICLVLLVWLSGLKNDSPPSWIPGVTTIALLRNVGLLVLMGLSLTFTSGVVRSYNHFSWGPLKEVAEVFIGIFATLIPVIAMLQQNLDGPFAGLIRLCTPDGVPNNMLYFWLTGGLSSFLDNAPTYLVFFNMAEAAAGGQVTQLISTMNNTLIAISTGAVFMGAMTYIGNAPNFMVRSIAEQKNISMPSFFGYMIWSICLLVPLFILMSCFMF